MSTTGIITDHSILTNIRNGHSWISNGIDSNGEENKTAELLDLPPEKSYLLSAWSEYFNGGPTFA